MKPKLARDFLTPKEFAECCGVRPATVERWIREGLLPAVRIGRIRLVPKDAFQRLLDLQEVGRRGEPQ